METSLKTEFKTILLKDIVTVENYRKQFDALDIKELTNSIAQKGVIEPIVVRLGSGLNKFELVCGERRYKAAQEVNKLFPDRNSIPSMVRDLTDDQVLEFQITENLQRKDVHPMEEAAAFKELRSRKGWDAKFIANKLGRTERYITQRLKLNDLISDFQKAFYAGRITLAEANKIVLISAGDQADLFKHESRGGKGPMEIDEYQISQYLMELDEAPFDINGASLKKGVGACTGCQYNSAVAVLLFTPEELKEDGARCMNAPCFKDKCKLAYTVRLKESLEDPGIVLVTDDYNFGPLATKLKNDGHPVLNNNQYYSNPTKSTNYPIKAFVVEGDDKGRFIYIRRSGGGAKASGEKFADKVESGKVTAADINNEIQAISERVKRGRELDEEKISPQIYNSLKKHYDSIGFEATGPLNKEELITAIYNCGMAHNNSFSKRSGVKYSGSHSLIKALSALNIGELHKLFLLSIRLQIEHVNMIGEGRHCRPDNDTHVVCNELILTSRNAGEVKRIRDAQVEVRKRREERAALRISKLKEELAAMKPVKAKKAK